MLTEDSPPSHRAPTLLFEPSASLLLDLPDELADLRLPRLGLEAPPARQRRQLEALLRRATWASGSSLTTIALYRRLQNFSRQW